MSDIDISAVPGCVTVGDMARAACKLGVRLDMEMRPKDDADRTKSSDWQAFNAGREYGTWTERERIRRNAITTGAVDEMVFRMLREADTVCRAIRVCGRIREARALALGFITEMDDPDFREVMDR